MELGTYFIAHFRAGNPGFYSGRKRGQVAVWHDSQLWIYDQPRDRREFKSALQNAFCQDDQRIIGCWPNYTIE